MSSPNNAIQTCAVTASVNSNNTPTEANPDDVDMFKKVVTCESPPSFEPTLSREQRLAERQEHLLERVPDLLQRAAINHDAGNIARAELLEARAHRAAELESRFDREVTSVTPDNGDVPAPDSDANTAREERLAGRHAHLVERAPDLLQRAAANREAGNIERAELLEARAHRVAELESRFDRNAVSSVANVEVPAEPEAEPDDTDIGPSV